MITLADRIFIATLATLFLAVLILEWNSKRLSLLPSHVLPPDADSVNLQNTNVPCHRGAGQLIEDVAYTSSDDAAYAGNE